jgi:hypothetical protein
VYHGFGPEHARAVERAALMLRSIERAGWGLGHRDTLMLDDLDETSRLIRTLLEGDDNVRWSRKAEVQTAEVEALRLKPGDRILVTLSHDLDQRAIEELRVTLEREFPDNRVVVCAPGIAFTVVKEEA